MDYVAMGRRIRNRRRACGLTQEALAAAVSISTSFLGHVERGTRKASVETLAKIRQAINLPLDEMILGIRCRAVTALSDEEELLLQISKMMENWSENR